MSLVPLPLPEHDDDALVDDEGVWSWRQLHQAVSARVPAFAGALCVPLQATTSKELLLDVLAARAAKAVPVLLPPRFPAAMATTAYRAVAMALAHTDSAVVADAADVTFTSGTLSAPRAVLHSRWGHLASARGANAHIAFGPGHRWLLSLPLVHVGGLGVVARALVGGGAMAFARAGEPLAEAIVRLNITHLSVVRAQLLDLLRSPLFEAARACLKAVLVGGGPTPEHLLSEAAQRGLPVAQTWGMTETHAQVATSNPGAPLTCGRPLAGREVRVDDDGLLWVRGPVLALGTLDQEQGLVPFALVDGWFGTGDRGCIDADGCVVVSGRAGNRIVSGGEKIEPEAIEAALLSHSDVVDAVVVPVPHARWGQRPVAFVRSRVPLLPALLAELVRTQLPALHVPDAFLPWPEQQTEGKPSRSAFRLYAEEMLR